MKKSKLFLFGLLAAILAGALVLAGCENAAGGGEPGRSGSDAPAFLTGGLSVKTVQYALDHSPIAVLDNVDLSDNGTVTVPAGKTLKIVGNFNANATNGNLINAVAGTLDIDDAATLSNIANPDVFIVSGAQTAAVKAKTAVGVTVPNYLATVDLGETTLTGVSYTPSLAIGAADVTKLAALTGTHKLYVGNASSSEATVDLSTVGTGKVDILGTLSLTAAAATLTPGSVGISNITANALNVTAGASFAGNTTFNSPVSFDGTATFGGAAVLKAAAEFKGAASVSSGASLAVDGTLTVAASGGTLAVDTNRALTGAGTIIVNGIVTQNHATKFHYYGGTFKVNYGGRDGWVGSSGTTTNFTLGTGASYTATSGGTASAPSSVTDKLTISGGTVTMNKRTDISNNQELTIDEGATLVIANSTGDAFTQVSGTAHVNGTIEVAAGKELRTIGTVNIGTNGKIVLKNAGAKFYLTQTGSPVLNIAGIGTTTDVAVTVNAASLNLTSSTASSFTGGGSAFPNPAAKVRKITMTATGGWGDLILTAHSSDSTIDKNTTWAQ